MNFNESDLKKSKLSNNDYTRHNLKPNKLSKPNKPLNLNSSLPVKPEFRYYGVYHFGEESEQRNDSSSSHND
ncbi:hypothetical protein NUSPORA_02716 [Nucleospora cyclopteri]